MIKSNIGKNIKNRRLELGLTQEELATKLGYRSKSSINKIEAGINDISQAKVLEFATALETTVSYLMGWEERDGTTATPTRTLTDAESTLLDTFDKLNDAGKSKVQGYAEAISENEEYTKQTTKDKLA